MSSLALLLISPLHQLGIPLAALLSAILCYFGLVKKKEYSFLAPTITTPTKPQPVKKTIKPKISPSKPTQWYRDLFFQLQNLEDYPEVLPMARDELLTMFSKATSLMLDDPKKSILSVEKYDKKAVWDFVGAEHDKCLDQWEEYLKRRKAGQGPEMFANAEEAKAWLVKSAPVKFVDGAWLAHTHKITTDFSLRSVTKDAWQVMSEELGDGDLTKHHVYLYRQLLDSIGRSLPDGHSREFIAPEIWQDIDNHGSWENAVGQLLISLFPNEFLPEILGFNMHYELITMDTMRAAHELKGFGIDPYYFLIHIAIDNADSGHTAMATHVVTRYLDYIRDTEGDEAVEQAWKRVQVGYTLSQTVGSARFSERDTTDPTTPGSEMAINVPLDNRASKVIEIFRSKALYSYQFHCSSRVKIGGHTLTEWLSPAMWTNDKDQERHQLQLLTGLSRAKPWVYPGDSKKSKLVKELSWEGRMFGAFTHEEVIQLTDWIDNLCTDNTASLYYNFTRTKPVASTDAVGQLQDPVLHHPVVSAPVTDKQLEFKVDHKAIEKQHLAPVSDAQLPDVVALWFAHIGLLENTINTPSITASPLHAKILRVLRAQAGFAVEEHIVAGMDEMRRLTCPSLVDIGLELIDRAGWGDAKPASLSDVLALAKARGRDGHQSARMLAEDMLRWGTRPRANLGLLVGLATALIELKDAVSSAPALLGDDSKMVLKAISEREKVNLDEIVSELRGIDPAQYKQISRGYIRAKSVLVGMYKK
ncbi:hypothetical protein F5Y16DRAFT_376409 [Xylariaceae sp. FL0255]|nr:hypothetical protein F5Y16DRAFT_376409 [Xylariaceae sp. FL0255]